MHPASSGWLSSRAQNPSSRTEARQPSAHRDQTLAIIMAGGAGSRLGALTRGQCKPALTFGGQYRNIDFPLSNCVNSGIRKVAILTQYESHSLIKHIQGGWSFLRPELGELLELWPAQQRQGCDWYAGTADAVYQNSAVVEAHDPAHVLVLAGDHIYTMDYAGMIEAHVRHDADVTVGCVEVPVAASGEFGIMDVDARGWIADFVEKPPQARPMPGRPGIALASMGIYAFKRAFLLERLAADARDRASRHDFGHNVVPAAIASGASVLSYPFIDRRTGAQGYWRDVGTIDGYWRAHMELLADPPGLDLNDASWPILSFQEQAAPAKLVGEGTARRSILTRGSVVAGTVSDSVVGAGCTVGEGSVVEQSVLLPGARIGAQCRISRAIIDSGCSVPDRAVIGDGLTGASGIEVSPQGVAVVTADAVGNEQSVHERSAA